jgi:hypothetical protein
VRQQVTALPSRMQGRPPGVIGIPTPASGSARPFASKQPAGPQVGTAIGEPPGSPGCGIAIRGGGDIAGDCAASGRIRETGSGGGASPPRRLRASRSRSPCRRSA